MTIDECYKQIGGNYDDVMNRLKSEALLKRLLPMFVNDMSFKELSSSLESGDTQAAFNAAHTLKGVLANLSLHNLSALASQITELLRQEELMAAKELYSELKAVYDLTVNTIMLVTQD